MTEIESEIAKLFHPSWNAERPRKHYPDLANESEAAIDAFHAERRNCSKGSAECACQSSLLLVLLMP